VTLDSATDLVRHTLVITLLIASPMLIIGLVVGVAISILQAITQIQEQTLTLIPKITAMMVAAAVLLPWIATRLMEYTAAVFTTGMTP
jgi:flagellar biosynthetic protein FliQ